MSAVRAALTLSVIECKISRIRSDAAAIESTCTLIAELRKLNPFGVPILDLQQAANDLRLAAAKLDQIRLSSA
jgi:hypothetical protein